MFPARGRQMNDTPGIKSKALLDSKYLKITENFLQYKINTVSSNQILIN